MNSQPFATIALATAAIFSTSSPALAQFLSHHQRTPTIYVSPAEELTILDPQVSPEKKPEAVVLLDQNGQERVDVAPSVIVHKYYYSGNREFRAPRLPGGPCVVVVTHPDSHERLYLDIQLLPGSPLIVYREDYIEYDYGKEQIRIQFENAIGLGKRCTPKVVYLKGCSHLAKREHQARHEDRQPDGIVHDVKQGTKNAIANSAVAVRKTGSALLTPVKAVVNATPIGSILHDDKLPLREQRDRALIQASSSIEDSWENSLPTNR